MIKKVLCALLIAILGMLSVSAQTSAPDHFVATVRVESAFARALPDFSADPTASIFEGEPLEAVSRNLDGTWFEMRRPGRFNNIGWVYEGTLGWEFYPELLPLGDFTTGLVGPNVLVSPPEYAVFLAEEPILRSQPTRRSPPVQPVVYLPPSVTVPVIARNQNGTWLFINYLGYQGWVVAFAGRDLPDVMAIQQAVDLPPLEDVPAVIIPVELQQAQIDRLRAFITEHRDYSQGLESFWWRVFRGEIMPCDAPPEFTDYPYSDEDVRELPELGRYVPRLGEAVDDMQLAVAPLHDCGIVAPAAVVDARDASINARIIFDATLQTLHNLEVNVVQAHR